ncbi:hypothetical protein BDR26DRAFT_868122 [Obelidium mucronatum]|nr:hypothetical protein BDR26DRAFT_868122 [Obelidium mucronatum]
MAQDAPTAAKFSSEEVKKWVSDLASESKQVPLAIGGMAAVIGNAMMESGVVSGAMIDGLVNMAFSKDPEVIQKALEAELPQEGEASKEGGEKKAEGKSIEGESKAKEASAHGETNKEEGQTASGEASHNPETKKEGETTSAGDKKQSLSQNKAEKAPESPSASPTTTTIVSSNAGTITASLISLVTILFL